MKSDTTLVQWLRAHSGLPERGCEAHRPVSEVIEGQQVQTLIGINQNASRPDYSLEPVEGQLQRLRPRHRPRWPCCSSGVGQILRRRRVRQYETAPTRG